MNAFDIYNTASSTTSRPWFVCPSWASVVPLLLHAVATAPDSDEATAAAAELQTLAAALDGWNVRGPALLETLRRALELLDAGEKAAARLRLSQALHLLEGEA